MSNLLNSNKKKILAKWIKILKMDAQRSEPFVMQRFIPPQNPLTSSLEALPSEPPDLQRQLDAVHGREILDTIKNILKGDHKDSSMTPRLLLDDIRTVIRRNEADFNESPVIKESLTVQEARELLINFYLTRSIANNLTLKDIEYDVDEYLKFHPEAVAPSEPPDAVSMKDIESDSLTLDQLANQQGVTARSEEWIRKHMVGAIPDAPEQPERNPAPCPKCAELEERLIERKEYCNELNSGLDENQDIINDHVATAKALREEQAAQQFDRRRALLVECFKWEGASHRRFPTIKAKVMAFLAEHQPDDAPPDGRFSLEQIKGAFDALLSECDSGGTITSRADRLYENVCEDLIEQLNKFTPIREGDDE